MFLLAGVVHVDQKSYYVDKSVFQVFVDVVKDLDKMISVQFVEDVNILHPSWSRM